MMPCHSRLGGFRLYVTLHELLSYGLIKENGLRNLGSFKRLFQLAIIESYAAS